MISSRSSVRSFATRALRPLLIPASALVVLHTTAIAATPASSEGPLQEVLLESFLTARSQFIDDEIALRTNLRTVDLNVQKQVMASWRENSRGRREALQAQARALVESRPHTVMPLIETVVVPPGATPELEGFIAARAELQNDRIEKQNGLVGATPEVRANGIAKFEEHILAGREELAKLGARIAAQSAEAPHPSVPKPVIPDAVDPKVKAFILERYKEMTVRRAFLNTLQTLPMSAREEATKTWEKEQLPRRAALAEKARQLSEIIP